MVDIPSLLQAVSLLTSSLEPWIVVPLGLLVGLLGGAALGISLAEAACKVLAEMATFAEAGVTDKE